MSHRPTDAKKLNRLRKALRRTPVTYIDLVQYLKDRRYAQTSGEARKMLTDGRVHVDSHVVGRIEVPVPFGKDGETEFRPDPLVLAHHRKSIVVR